MSASDPDEEQAATPPDGHAPGWSAPVPEPVAGPDARQPWSPWSELRGDLRGAAAVVALLALSGFLVGLLWWALAPRASFRITADGPVAIGNPSEELFAADDAIFALLLAGLGILAGVLAWSLLRRRRGVAMLLALAVGTAAAAVIAWQLGQRLGPAPSHAAVLHVGGRVTTGLTL